MLELKYFEDLKTAAEVYRHMGYSVIPLWGDKGTCREKTPAVEWKQYQRRQPSLFEIERWFLKEKFAGLGIVTGRISGLAVIDMDTPEVYELFKQTCPDLWETRTVETKRGFHLYYGLPPSLTLLSRRVRDVDLQSNGRYVVAYPTVIDGRRYELIRGGLPKTLTQEDINRINIFVNSRRNPDQPQVVEPEVVEDAAPKLPVKPRPYHLVDLYLYLAGEGRNRALFRVATIMRDEGWSIEETLACLVDVHAKQRPNGEHRKETYEQRQDEARRTIKSAYSRPARPRKRDDQRFNNHQLPNSCREKFFSFKQTGVVRVIEGLRLCGIEPGQTFTAGQAVRLLKGRVGRDTIYAALNAALPDGQPVFLRASLPQPPPLADAAMGSSPSATTNKCSVGCGQKAGKTPPSIEVSHELIFIRKVNNVIISHRPARDFVMPGNLELCGKLDVKPTLSDPLTLDDIASVKKLRMASQREFVKRRPGPYPRRFLAERLNVCVRTLHAYNRGAPIQVTPTFVSQKITGTTFDSIPETPIPGTFLVDADTGKRYPPLPVIAAMLLKEKKTVKYVRQLYNYYLYVDPQPDFWPLRELRARQDKIRQQMTRDTSPRYWSVKIEETLPQTSVTEASDRPQPQEPRPIVVVEQIAPLKPPPTKPLRRLRWDTHKNRYRRKLRDEAQENLAMRVYKQVNMLVKEQKERISKATARRLVDFYDRDLIDRGLYVLSHRHTIQKPVGFFIVYLSSENAARHNGWERK